jgi:hypothetical protein
MSFHEIQNPLSTAPIIWCDNVSALSLAANPVYQARTKHIEVDYHYVREKVLNRDVKVSFISTADQIANVFTKDLTSARFLYLKSKLKVIPSPFSFRGHVKHTIHSNDPADVPNAPTPDDPDVDTVDVPDALYDYARAHPLERSSALLTATYQHEYARAQAPMPSSVVIKTTHHKTCTCSHLLILD